MKFTLKPAVFFFFMTAMLFIRPSLSYAGPGDTIIVQTWINDEYTWPEFHQQTFPGFPDTSVTIRKAWIRYYLNCAAGGCDPWDVGAPIQLGIPNGSGGYNWIELARYITPYAKTGVWDLDVTDYLPLLRDSVHLGHSNASYTGGPDGYSVTMDFYFVEGTPPREPYKVEKLWQGGYQYGNNYSSTSYDLAVETDGSGDSIYTLEYDTYIVHDVVTSFDSAKIEGTGFTTFTPFRTAAADAISQILVKASELTAGGIGAGNLTGLRFNIATLGSPVMQDLTIRVKHTALTELNGAPESGGWTEVYNQWTSFSSTGWHDLQFTTPFNWNGSSNIVFDISFDNDAPGSEYSLAAHNGTDTTVTYNTDIDHYMYFGDTGSVTVPAAAIPSVTNAVTISFWQYGDMDKLPDNTVVFDARNAANQRVMNIHLPWSDRNVYWDCGNSGSGSYDRIYKASPDPWNYQGKWNHWAFVKDVTAGTMKIYLNGAVWHSGTGLTRTMDPVTNIRIGADADGNLVCKSKLDEFQVWNVALDSATINQWMWRKPDASHPMYANLQVYYPFDNGAGTIISDGTMGAHHGTYSGVPVWEGHQREGAINKYPAVDRNTVRPNMVIEQGVYTSHYDSVLVDSALSIIVDTILYYNHFDSTVTPRDVALDPGFSQLRLKTRTSGHGFGGALNCAEFCARTHHISLNGTQIYTWLNWNDWCGMNACFPQGGTWIYDRAGWCPGEPVVTRDYELTGLVTPGTTVELDYGCQSYTWDGIGSTPTWELANHLIYYKAPAFTLDATVDDVISPSKTFIHGRFNPICSHPEIMIQNTGTTTLTSLEIVYRVTGGADSVYNWTGSLGFLQKEKVLLGGVDWSSGSTTFEVFVRNPNGGTDQYALNDTMRSQFTAAPVWPGFLDLFWRTNNAGTETKYTLKDQSTGAILYQSSPFLVANTIYHDLCYLPAGCYELRVWDTGKDGLSFFANSDGTGFFRINEGGTGVNLKTLPADFGTQLLVDFVVDSGVTAVPPPVAENEISIYPNPAQDKVNVDLLMVQQMDVTIEIFSSVGTRVLYRTYEKQGTDVLTLDLSDQPAGVYMVHVKAGSETYTERLVLTGGK